MNKEMYGAKVVCQNCQAGMDVKIPNGQTKRDWILKHPGCPVCGCFLIHGLDPVALALFHRPAR